MTQIKLGDAEKMSDEQLIRLYMPELWEILNSFYFPSKVVVEVDRDYTFGWDFTESGDLEDVAVDVKFQDLPDTEINLFYIEGEGFSSIVDYDGWSKCSKGNPSFNVIARDAFINLQKISALGEL
jgi:hypothetical protein